MAKSPSKQMLTLVTGGSRGIGFAIAQAMAAKGSDLLLVAKHQVGLDRAKRAIIKKHAVTITTFAGDLSSESQVNALAQMAIKKSLVPNMLVLNAGIFIEGSLTASRPKDYRATFDVNLHSIYYLVQALVPYMEGKRNPRIVLIGSTAGYEPYPVGALYGVAKWAVRGYAVNLRRELMDKRIGVTLLSPGGTLTDLWAGEVLPPDRLLDPSDVATLVAVLPDLSHQAVVEEIIIRPMLGDMHD
jgi:short-subunit dehydrogenase